MTQMIFPGMKRLPKTKVHQQPDTDSTPAIMMPSHGLTRALSVNQFKNAFDDTSEPGIGRKRSEYMAHREMAEEHLFGVPIEAPPEKRPIYGYLEDKTHSLSDDLESYGDVNVHIKWPEPGKNVTTTLGDSLNNYGAGRWGDRFAPKKLIPFRHYAIQSDIDFHGGGVPYREVQWHDHPSPREDITAVHLSASDSDGDASDEHKQILERHKELAQHFRAAGLPHTTPIISSIKYNKKTDPTLFDAHPESVEHIWPYYRRDLFSRVERHRDVREV